MIKFYVGGGGLEKKAVSVTHGKLEFHRKSDAQPGAGRPINLVMRL